MTPKKYVEALDARPEMKALLLERIRRAEKGFRKTMKPEIEKFWTGALDSPSLISLFEDRPARRKRV
jgi:hypothetical protein